jgi:LysR family transcriptional regulator AphB
MLDDLALFVSVARAGSFSAAASDSGIPLSTVSRRVGDLERRMGAKVFERTTRRLRLTEFGAQLLERTEASIESLAEAIRLRMPVGGVIRATAPPLAARTRLGAGLIGFLQDHQHVSLEIITTNRHLDFVRDNIDIAFRIGPLDDSSLVAVKLWDVPYSICAGGQLAEQLAKRSDPIGIDQLNALPAISMGQVWRFVGLPAFHPHNIVHRIDECELAASAVKAGLGLAYLPRDMVQQVGIEVPLDGLVPQDKALYALYPERRLLPAHLRELIDWLKARG